MHKTIFCTFFLALFVVVSLSCNAQRDDDDLPTGPSTIPPPPPPSPQGDVVFTVVVRHNGSLDPIEGALVYFYYCTGSYNQDYATPVRADYSDALGAVVYTLEFGLEIFSLRARITCSGFEEQWTSAYEFHSATEVQEIVYLIPDQ